MPTQQEPIDFVFLDDRGDPYRVKDWSGEVWLFRWTKAKTWVSVRSLTQMDVWYMDKKSLPPEQAALYHTEETKDVV